jgi:hypothetical protein
MELFVPLTKVDAEKRLVYGVLAAEQVDRSGEVMDYATSKPFFEAWSGDIAKATEGKSVGNLRAMHGKVAAGKFTDLQFDDTNKRIEAIAKVVDDTEWNKVLEGVYTGFSIGGKYVKSWQVDGKKHYTAGPAEGSLVDYPCIPSATFEVIKVDGSTELRKFIAPDPKAAIDELAKMLDSGAIDPRELVRIALAELSKSAPTPVDPDAPVVPAEPEADDPMTLGKRAFSDDQRKAAAKKGDALPDGSFPIETKGDLENAIKAYGRAKDPAAAKKHIIERAKALDATDLLPDGWTGKDADTADADAAKALLAAELGKRGSRNSSADQKHLQDAHDALVAAGAKCDGDPAAGADPDNDHGAQDDGEMARCAGIDELCKAAEITPPAGEQSLAKIANLVIDLAKAGRRIAELEAMPVPVAGKLRVVEKAAEVTANAGNGGAEEAQQAELEKAAQAQIDGDPLPMVKFIHKYGAQVQRPNGPGVR